MLPASGIADAPPQPHTHQKSGPAQAAPRGPPALQTRATLLRVEGPECPVSAGGLIAGAYRQSVNTVAVRESTRRINGVAGISFEHMTKRYPVRFEAVTDMNLEIADGEFMILVGPSGSGMSTALRWSPASRT